MKRFFSYWVICFMSFSSYCQSVYLVKGEVYTNGTLLYSKLDTTECNTDYTTAFLSHELTMYIIGDTICHSKFPKWYIVMNGQDIYLAEKYFFRESKKLDSLLNIVKQKTPDIKDRAKFALDEISQIKTEEKKRIEAEEKEAEEIAKEQAKKDKREIDSLTKLLDKTLATLRAKNLVLYDWSWSYPNEYSSFSQVSITVLNPYKQKIKYLWFTFRAFNPVGDLIRDGFTGKSDKTVKGIGPIEYGDRGSYNFESVFYSKVIDKMRVTQIKIQFFDGSFKVISNPVEFNKDEYIEE